MQMREVRSERMHFLKIRKTRLKLTLAARNTYILAEVLNINAVLFFRFNFYTL